MAFPITLIPSSPSGLDSPRLGDDEIRALKQLLADLFTLPVSPSTISATIGSVSTGGKLTITNGTWTADVVTRAYGGTGLSAAGTSGNVLTSNGTNWTSATPGASGYTISGANGQSYTLGYKTELTTIAAEATSATTITIPADAILKAVTMRVTVAPPGTTTMVVTATTSLSVLQVGASMSTALNTTNVGTNAWGNNYFSVAAQTITFTPNATPSDATGRVRVDIFYELATPPTS